MKSALFVFLVFGAINSSLANTANFESLHNPSRVDEYTVHNGYSGFEWNGFMARDDSLLSSNYSNNQQVKLSRQSLLGNVAAFGSVTKTNLSSFSSQMKFNLDSLDMFLVGGYGPDSSVGGADFFNVTVGGWRDGVVVTSKVVSLRSGLISSNQADLPATDYHFIFNWSGIDRVSISTPMDSKWTNRTVLIDNINTAPVPEPETYAMLLAGLGVIGWSLRKRKQSEH